MDVLKFDPQSLEDPETREILCTHLENAFKEASKTELYQELDPVSFCFGVLIASGLPANIAEEETLTKDFVDVVEEPHETEADVMFKTSFGKKDESKH